MPHRSEYSKTRDGYILDIEIRLEIEKLPKAYYRLSIDEAFQLWNETIKRGKIGFINEIQILKLPFVSLREKE
jgi:hypothetical protein